MLRQGTAVADLLALAQSPTGRKSDAAQFGQVVQQGPDAEGARRR
jgi:antitoxin (DNA-binding transcriptional repressor) of toxin-antitoxin stability system